MAPDGIAQAMIFATGVFVGGGVVLGAAMVTALARWASHGRALRGRRG